MPLTRVLRKRAYRAGNTKPILAFEAGRGAAVGEDENNTNKVGVAV